MKTHVKNSIESLIKRFSIEILSVDNTVILFQGEILFSFETSQGLLRKVYDSHHCIH